MLINGWVSAVRVMIVYRTTVWTHGCGLEAENPMGTGSMTQYQINYFSLEVTLPMDVTRYLRCSAPKLHKSTLAAILYMFVTQTLAIATALG